MMLFFWVLTTRGLVIRYQCFEEPTASIFSPVRGQSMFFPWNILVSTYKSRRQNPEKHEYNPHCRKKKQKNTNVTLTAVKQKNTNVTLTAVKTEEHECHPHFRKNFKSHMTYENKMI
jgi:hypothetical protein